LPTFESLSQFDREFAELTPDQRKAFRAAVLLFVADLRARQGFTRGLRVKRVQGTQDVWELTWAPDGRATWQYGPEELAGEPHVIWRRIGSHSIFRQP
jgi:hypothetical protein